MPSKLAGGHSVNLADIVSVRHEDQLNLGDLRPSRDDEIRDLIARTYLVQAIAKLDLTEPFSGNA